VALVHRVAVAEAVGVVAVVAVDSVAAVVGLEALAVVVVAAVVQVKVVPSPALAEVLARLRATNSRCQSRRADHALNCPSLMLMKKNHGVVSSVLATPTL
jgi:hypothetical protein